MCVCVYLCVCVCVCVCVGGGQKLFDYEEIKTVFKTGKVGEDFFTFGT